MSDIAIFADHENIFYSCLNNENSFPNYEAVRQAAHEFGDRVAFAACYADWDKMSAGIRFVVAAGFTPRMCPDTKTSGSAGYQQRKSSLDNILAAEMMETLMHNPNIEVFVLVSGDRDYIPFVNLLRREGKTVVVIGEERSVARDLREAADSYIYLQQIEGSLRPAHGRSNGQGNDLTRQAPPRSNSNNTDVSESEDDFDPHEDQGRNLDKPECGGFEQAAQDLESGES